MPEVTDAPPSPAEIAAGTPGAPAPVKEHWKVKEKREREEAATTAAVAPPPAPVAPKMPEMPIGGWPGDTPPTITGPSVDPVSVVYPTEAPVILSFAQFVERFFTTNMIRPGSYEAPKMIRSVAADCVSAYHAYIYTIALGYGVTAKSPEARRFGGVHGLRDNLTASIEKMDREMDGR
jgi:hypothetical protein